MLSNSSYNQSLIGYIKDNQLFANIVLALLYIAFAQYGYFVANIDHLISPIWPPYGLVMAAAILGLRKLAPGLFIGVLSAQLISGNEIITAIAITLGVAMSAYVAYRLSVFATQLQPLLGKGTIPIWLIGSSLLTPLVSSTIGTACLFQFEAMPPDVPNITIWITWWMGDAIGGLVITPIILSIRKINISATWLIKVILLTILSGLTYTLIFFDGSNTPLLFLAFPILLLACHWFGPAGSAWSTLFFVAWAIAVSFLMPEANTLPLLDDHLLLFDFFIFALAVTSLTLSTFYRKEYFFLPSIIFLVGWTFCGWLHYSLKQNTDELDETRFSEIVEEAEQSVQQRLSNYIDALRASAAYFVNSVNMKHREWRAYVSYVNIDQHYPGINGLGFILPFTNEALDQYVAELRANELPDFSIKNVPEVKRPGPDEMGIENYIITHIEPIETNLPARGLNVASEVNRQTAARIARDTGEPTMTNRITLVQDGQSRPGFLIYMPIYKANMPTNTVPQRREAFVGWSYAPFVTEAFLNGVLGARNEQIHFEVYDHEIISPKHFVYGSKKQPAIATTDFDYVTHLQLAGRTYSFGWKRGPEFQKQDTHSATIAAASLALGTCLLVGIVVSLQTTNRRVHHLVETKTAELLQTNNDLTREVHDRKRAEMEAEEAKRTAESANFAKSEFLATMSHEIRTPMNSVIGFSELLIFSDLTAEQRLWANYIQSSGESLLHIINDILDISKIEAGKLTIENIPFDLEEAMGEVIGSFNTIAAEKGILINNATNGVMPGPVLGDPVRVKQILTNLIGNALKFTTTGHILANIIWEGNATEGKATLSIADTGIGIPEDRLDKLFDKFTQADSSTTREFGGTGLGLAICKQLTHMMNGEIRASSIVNEGTTMYVTLPFKCHANKKRSSSPKERTTNTPFIDNGATAPEILLVDDNLVNQKLGLTILRRLGCTVTVADNGHDAIAFVKERTPSIIFMDCQMPVIDGYQTTQMIRELEASSAIALPPQNGKIIIIALTANASPQDRTRCLEAGMDDYLRKPSSTNDFKHMLETYWTA